MREVKYHHLKGVNASAEPLQVLAVDTPGPDGASNHYQILDVSQANTGPDADRLLGDIRFQHGPIREAGVNGVSVEAQLAVLIDRLEGFQDGPYACVQNERVLDHLHDALRWLHRRTQERLTRGVEGVSKP